MLSNWLKWLPYIIVERLAVRYCMKFELDDTAIIQAFPGRTIGISNTRNSIKEVRNRIGGSDLNA